MQLFKIFVVLTIIWLLVKYVSHKRKIAQHAAASREPSEIESMVQCAACGLYLPESESLRADGRSFCSSQHQSRWSG